MNVDKSTALVLRAGILVGMALMAAGLAMSMTGNGDGLLYAGTLVLVASPFAGVLTTLAALVSEKDWFWAGIAAVLVAVTVAGMAIAAMRRY